MAAKYDLVVLGAGPAGEKGAAQAAYFGKRVAVVDPRYRGRLFRLRVHVDLRQARMAFLFAAGLHCPLASTLPFGSVCRV